MIEQTVGPAHLSVDAERGGRLASLVVHGNELLIGPAPDEANPLGWGSYPMVPFAGRIRHGRFMFDGRAYELPANLGDHAIHGYGFGTAWEVVAPDRLRLDLPRPWPFGGWAEQRISLRQDRLELELSVHADPARGPMPATAGWHPWFRRPVDLTFHAGAMLRRNGEGIPDGTLLRPHPAGPWDDCFTELGGPPTLSWPGSTPALTLAIEHDCDYLVVYDEPDHALCVEPQTGPPDAFNAGAPGIGHIVHPGKPLVAHMTWRWD